MSSVGEGGILPLERTRLEKALADQGYDLTPTLDGEWLLGSSTQHPNLVWVACDTEAGYRIALSNQRLLQALAAEAVPVTPLHDGPKAAVGGTLASNYQDAYRLLGRIAALSRSLPNQLAKRFALATQVLPTSTEAERLVVQRVGQGLFRAALIDYWEGRCAVTGLQVVPLLRASHIKPWSECVTDEERLDIFNGLLLAPNLDAAFDGGWVSFDDDGRVLIAAELESSACSSLGLDSEMALHRITDAHRLYLNYHRSNVFLGK